MKTFGLIGYPLSHSWSASYFKEKFRKEKISGATYRLFPVKDLENFRTWVSQNPGLCGLNVTIPHKEKIIPHLDTLHEVATDILAVNTIKISREKEKLLLHGYNTDAFGFEKSLEVHALAIPENALILGTGGAAKAVAWVLEKINCPYMQVSRFPSGENEISYAQTDEQLIREYPFIINCTPLGMSPKTESFPPLPYHFLNPRNTLYDLVYNPPLTKFLEFGKAAGCKIVNGQTMLKFQAEKAWQIWNE